MMRKITIEIDGDRHFDVVEDGKRCDGLTWDEMLGQIAEMTHYKIGVGRYPMRTAEEWALLRTEHSRQFGQLMAAEQEHDPSAKP